MREGHRSIPRPGPGSIPTAPAGWQRPREPPFAGSAQEANAERCRMKPQAADAVHVPGSA